MVQNWSELVKANWDKLNLVGTDVDGSKLAWISDFFDEFIKSWLLSVSPNEKITFTKGGGLIARRGKTSTFKNRFEEAISPIKPLDENLDWMGFDDPKEWIDKIFTEKWLPPLREKDCVGLKVPNWTWVKGKDGMQSQDIETENGYYTLGTIDMWDLVSKRAKEESAPKHITSTPVTINIVVSALGPHVWETNWPLRALRSYIDMMNGQEPFLPDKSGAIDHIKFDCTAGVRMTQLLSAAVYYEMFNDDISKRAIEGAVRFIFRDVNFRTSEFKKPTTVSRQSICIHTNSGYYPVYNGNSTDPSPAYNGYQVYSYNDRPMDDHAYAEHVQPILAEEMDWFRKNVPEMEPLITRMLSGESEEAIRSSMLIGAMVAFAGFTRARSVLSHQQNIDVDLEELKKNGYDESAEIPAYDYIKAEAQMISQKGIDRANKNPGSLGSWMTWDQFKVKCLQGLTTNSAGGAIVEVEFDLPNPIPGLKSQRITRRLTDKMSNFFALGSFVFGKEAIQLKYDRDSPGTIGNRQVPGGKPDRAIYVVRLTDALLQRTFFVLLHGQQLNDDEMSIGKGTGAPFVDFFSQFFHTARGVLTGLAIDFSGFDVHINKQLADAFKAGLLEPIHYLEATWGPWNSLYDAVHDMLSDGKVQKTVFRSGRGEFPINFDIENIEHVKFAAERLGIYMQLVDIMLSGRSDTIHRNNGINRPLANYMWAAIEKEAPEIAKKIRIISRLFQGDDSIAMWEFLIDITAEDIKILTDILVRAAARNRMELNGNKTTFRKRRIEYTKVEAVDGKAVPLLQVQLFAAENINPLEDPSILLAGYKAKLATLEVRGVPMHLTNLIFMFTAAHRRARKIWENDSTGLVFPPFACIWVPENLKGSGVVPWSLSFANSVIPMMSLMERDSVAKSLLNHAAFVLAGVTSNVKEEIARALMASGKFDNGVDYIKSVQPQSRKKTAAEASARLGRLGVKVPRALDYQDQATQLGVLGLSSTKLVRGLDLQNKTASGNNILARMLRGGDEPDMFKEFNWMRAFTENFTFPVVPTDQRNGHPYFMVDQYHLYFLRVMGLVSSNDLGRLRIGRIASILSSDPFFFGRISEEELAKLLTNPKLIANPTAMSDMIQAIGGGSDTSRKIISEVYASGVSTAILQKDTIGLTTSVNALGARNAETARRLLDIPFLSKVLHPAFGIVVRDYAFTSCVSEYYRTGKFRFLKIDIKSAQAFDMFNQELVGASYNKETFKVWSDIFDNYSETG
jgi:hypothetical protein